MKWNAIDLHMHTISGVTRNGDGDNVNFTYLRFIQVVKNYNLKLMAVTNHNIINLENYFVIKFLANKLGAKVLLGVEIDTYFYEQNPLHLLLIFGEDFSKNLNISKNINEKSLKKKKTKEVVYTFEEILKIIKDTDTILIPHGDKEKGMFAEPTKENIKIALRYVREGFIRVFDSPSNWKLEEIKKFVMEEKMYSEAKEYGGVLFSDIRDWNNYEKKFKHFVMYAEPTYKGLLHSITNPTKRFSIEKEALTNINFINKITISSSEKLKESSILLDQSYNCIIGKSGSGKSLLVHLINKMFNDTADKSFNYSFANQSTVNFYDNNNNLLKSSDLKISLADNLYDEIIQSHSANDPEQIYEVVKIINKSFVPREKFDLEKEKYKNKILKYADLKDLYSNKIIEINERQLCLNNELKELYSLKNVETFIMKPFENISITYSNNDFTKFKEFGDHIDGLRDILKVFKGAIEQKNEILFLLDNLSIKYYQLQKEINLVNCKEKYLNKKIDLINNVINKINSGISDNAQKKSNLIKSKNDNIKKLPVLYKEAFLLKTEIKNFDLSINFSDFENTSILNDKNNIYIKENLNPGILKNINIRNNSVFKTQGFKKDLEDKNYDLSNKDESKKIIDKYLCLGVLSKERDWWNTEFEITADIFINGQNVKQINPGDLAKTYIKIYFENEVNNGKNNVVIFDQIENDVDKDFINSVIIDLIEETKGKVQTIIVTHDPLIAVNADPINYIIAEKDTEGIFYKNYVPESYEINVLDKIADIVDGSKDAIKRRYKIYQGE